MELKLSPLHMERAARFKKDMQDAFQQGAEDTFGKMDEEILPESHIDRSLAAEGAEALEAVVDGEMVGGAIVVIDEKTHCGHLDFLYVKNGAHGKGIGQAIWKAIEARFPDTKVWETVTPYFEKRNIHFYMNKCGFHAVEFFNRWHKDPNDPDNTPDSNYFEVMFRFEKRMQ